MAWFVYSWPAMITLGELSHAAGATLHGDADVAVSGIAYDSRRVRPGELFVALRGEHTHGAAHLDEAVGRGVCAVCVERDAVTVAESLPVPRLVTDDCRVALALMSAAFHGCPARDLRLVGITGTLGKTSTAAFVQSALARGSGGRGVGVVGSLGLAIEGRDDTALQPVMGLDGMTTPDPPALHRALRLLSDGGVRTVVMEVTSHALAHDRVRGIRFALGVLTNLVPDEHLDFHGTVEAYLEVKARFFDHLLSGAPLVYNTDDALVREMVSSRAPAAGSEVVSVGVSGARDAREAAVSVERVSWHQGGSNFILRVRRSLPILGGGTVDPGCYEISLPLLGVQHVTNAALAAVTALIGGAAPADVVRSLSAAAPVRRRMEIVRTRPLIIDDTTGNPESLRAVFQTIESIPRSSLRVLFGLRGSRGVDINTLLAEALVELVIARAAHEQVRVVVTWAEDVAGERDRVTDGERAAVLELLDDHLGRPGAAVSVTAEATLARAVEAVLQDVAPDALVLLLGTQGMDGAAAMAQRVIAGRGEGK